MTLYDENRPAISRRWFLRTSGAAAALAAPATGLLALRPESVTAESPSRAADASSAPFAFTHPGILHRLADLNRMKAAVAAQQAPVYQGFQAMAADRRSALGYPIRNTGQITSWGRGPANYQTEADDDSGAAYQQALMWYITGDVRYADNARDILNAWSASLQSITGADGQLGTGLQGFMFVNAAEILRYAGYTCWAADDIARCEESFRTVWYQSLSGYALFANGNWDTAALQAIIAIAVFTNDQVMFEEALRFATAGAGNGAVVNYIINPAGQCQESGRDQAHAQLGVGLLADAAQVAWNQGVDLYGYAGNRILAGYEYMARYNLGNSVPFIPNLDRTGKYIHTAISSTNRGAFRPIYEMAYAHYAGVMGLSAPYTEQVISRGPGGSRVAEGYNSDEPSWGTLTFGLVPGTNVKSPQPSARPGTPAGLLARGSADGVTLSWISSVDPASATAADSYTLRRAAACTGPYQTIATGVTATAYTDRTARADGGTYYYTVAARGAAGESPRSVPAAASPGLPPGWSAQDLGAVATPGSTAFDGRTFTVEASGQYIGGSTDQFRFTYLPVRGDGTITARVVYPVSSQYATVAVMMRRALTGDSAHAAMLLQGLPQYSWSGVWMTRTTTGGTATATGSTLVPPTQQLAITTDAGFPISDLGMLSASATPLLAPNVEAAGDGYRMRMPYWVRLTRRGNTFTGLISPDGQHWTQVGSATVALDEQLYAGLAACSALGLPESYAQTGTAAFDNVTVAAVGTRWSVMPPAAPAGPLRAEAGVSAINLTCSDLDLSARYTVKRANSSAGPYRVLATGISPAGFGVAARYADATGTPGMTYYYRMVPANVAGEGPASTVASATMPVPRPPAITSTATAFANTGIPFRYFVTATNNPVSFAATDLPDGLRIDAATGMISGVPEAPGTATVQLTASNATATARATLTLTVAEPPPAPWAYRDIGEYVVDERQLGIFAVAAVLTPGITSYDHAAGRFTVRGAGSDLNINGQGMTAQYAYQQVAGDAAITARVVSRANAGTADRVGLVMGKSLNPFDQMAGAILTSDGTGSAGSQQFLRRLTVAGNSTTATGAGNAGVPVWLRLERTGQEFSASSSPDGVNWTPIASAESIPHFGDAPYYAGLAVSSREPLLLNTTVFDNVSVTSSGQAAGA